MSVNASWVESYWTTATTQGEHLPGFEQRDVPDSHDLPDLRIVAEGGVLVHRQHVMLPQPDQRHTPVHAGTAAGQRHVHLAHHELLREDGVRILAHVFVRILDHAARQWQREAANKGHAERLEPESLWNADTGCRKTHGPILTWSPP